MLKGTVDIQGMIAIEDVPESKAVHILWAVAAPQNNIYATGSKQYEGVGGHLFAIAINHSVKLGYHGFVYGEAANKKLMNRYIDEYGARSFPFGYP